MLIQGAAGLDQHQQDLSWAPTSQRQRPSTAWLAFAQLPAQTIPLKITCFSSLTSSFRA